MSKNSDFFKRIKLNVKKPKINKKQETEAEEAKRLAGLLKAYIVALPLINPTTDKKKLPEQFVQTFSEILNTSNKSIIENEFYPQVKKYLEKILKINKETDGFTIDDIDYLKAGRYVQRFFYSFQDREYLEQR